MENEVSREDYELVVFLRDSLQSYAVTEEEFDAVLLKLLWDRESDPPLWAAEIIDSKRKRTGTLTGLMKCRYSDPVFSKDQYFALKAIGWVRRYGFETFDVLDDDEHPKHLMAAYHRHPEIVARFREVFPAVTWPEIPKEPEFFTAD